MNEKRRCNNKARSYIPQCECQPIIFQIHWKSISFLYQIYITRFRTKKLKEAPLIMELIHIAMRGWPKNLETSNIYVIKKKRDNYTLQIAIAGITCESGTFSDDMSYSLCVAME